MKTLLCEYMSDLTICNIYFLKIKIKRIRNEFFADTNNRNIDWKLLEFDFIVAYRNKESKVNNIV